MISGPSYLHVGFQFSWEREILTAIESRCVLATNSYCIEVLFNIYIIFLWKSDCLGYVVLLCFVVCTCMTLLASSVCISH